MKRILMSLVLLLLGSLVALLVGEGVVRRWGGAPGMEVLDDSVFRLSENKALGYEMIPRRDADGRPIPFEDKPGSVNSWGYRDVEHSVAKAPGVTRILVLGDSITFGLRVERFSDTFPAKLERNLKAAGVSAEVINFGVCGYDTGQELELLKRRGLALQPDVVMVAYCMNDHVGISDDVLVPLLQRARGDAILGKPRLGRFLARSAFYRLVRYRLIPDAARSRSAESMLKSYSRADAVPGALGELSRLQGEHDFRALVVVFPFLDHLDHYAHGSAHGSIRGLCEQNGLPVLDLLPAFQSCAGSDTERIAADLFHPNADGHTCAADAIARHLLDSKLVPVSK